MRALCLLFLSLVASSCGLIKPGSAENHVLLDIDGTPVYSEEFIYNFSKNASNTDSTNTKEEVDEYLDLYINFKLKDISRP
jgi:peptidyl-prolyl cis-trans isomerase SurA